MNDFMQYAFKESLKAIDVDDVPVGAVVICNGKIISKAYNRKESQKDATKHAEIIAISSACKKGEVGI